MSKQRSSVAHLHRQTGAGETAWESKGLFTLPSNFSLLSLLPCRCTSFLSRRDSRETGRQPPSLKPYTVNYEMDNCPASKYLHTIHLLRCTGTSAALFLKTVVQTRSKPGLFLADFWQGQIYTVPSSAPKRGSWLTPKDANFLLSSPSHSYWYI